MMTQSTTDIAREFERAQGCDQASLVLALSGPHVLAADCNASVRPLLYRGAVRVDVDEPGRGQGR